MRAVDTPVYNSTPKALPVREGFFFNLIMTKMC